MEVPEDLPSTAETVYLQSNLITSISHYSFSNLPNCLYLDLSFNNIPSISAESFVGTLSAGGIVSDQ